MKIRFKGEEFFLIGTKEKGGAIAYPGQVDEAGNIRAEVVLALIFGDSAGGSYAHMTPEGNIYRYNQVIGTRDEVEFLDEVALAAEAA
jgi:hypothetical protein